MSSQSCLDPRNKGELSGKYRLRACCGRCLFTSREMSPENKCLSVPTRFSSSEVCYSILNRAAYSVHGVFTFKNKKLNWKKSLILCDDSSKPTHEEDCYGEENFSAMTSALVIE